MPKVLQILAIILLLTLLPISSYAQFGGSLVGQVIQPAAPNGSAAPASFVQVRVCPNSGSGVPCSPLASLFADPFLTTPVTNPYTTDANGNFDVFLGPGYYIVQIAVTSTVTYSYLYNVTINPILVSTSFANADRCAGILTAINQVVNGVSASPVDARPEIAISIPCNSNMLPSNLTGTANSSSTGGELLWPSGAFDISVGQQLAVNGYHVQGIGLGTTAGTGPTTLFPSASFNFGSGSTFNPAVLALGANAGQIATGLGPFSSTIDHFKVDCNFPTSPVGMGVTYFSGQENTYLDYFGIDHCPATSLSIGGGSNSTGDGGKISNFYIQHTGSGGGGSCPVPTAYNVQSWSYNAASHVVTMTATGGSPTVMLSHGAIISGLATGAAGVTPNHPAAHVCAIGAVSDDQTCQGLTLSANQFAYIYNGGSTNDSSSTAQGTATVYPVGIRDVGQGNRDIRDGSIVSNCVSSAYPLTSLDINTSLPLLAESIHLEDSQIGLSLGTEANTVGASIVDVQPSFATDGGHIFSSPGWIVGPTNFINFASKLGTTNAIVDEFSGNTLTHNQNATVGYYLTDINGQGVLTNAFPEAGLKNGFDFTGSTLSVYGGAISTSSLVSGGTGYHVGDSISVDSPTSGNNATVVVASIGGSGNVLTYTLFNAGSGYVPNYQATATTPATGKGPSTTNNLTNASGSGFTINVTSITSTLAASISEMGLITQTASAIYMPVLLTSFWDASRNHAAQIPHPAHR